MFLRFFVVLTTVSFLPCVSNAQTYINTINGQTQSIILQGETVTGTFRNNFFGNGALFPFSHRRITKIEGSEQIEVERYIAENRLLIRSREIRDRGFLPGFLYYIVPGSGLVTGSYGEVLFLANHFRQTLNLKNVDMAQLFIFNAAIGNELKEEFYKNSVIYLPFIK